MSSTMVYMNEWLVLPIFVFAWLPLLYYNRIKSVPEYFEKRFNRPARYVAVLLILAYIFYYIGYNLYTIGLALHGLFNISPLYTVPVVTLFLGFYVSCGGQTAVILTDLFQGLLLYLAGFLVVGFGLYALGGIDTFWSYLPVSHRLPFSSLNADPYFNAVGVFWGDALVGSAAFLFMNQGVLMRFLATRSVRQARMTALFNVLICLPLSAITVGAAGWIAKAIISKQEQIGSALPGYSALNVTDTYYVFINVAFEVLKQHEWLLGLVIAALLAALMSTVDTLINASSAIGVYDIYKPLIRPKESEKHYLKVARLTSVLVIGISLLLVVWFFRQKGTLMAIHYKGIMTIIPPVVTTLFMAIFWKKFDAFSAILAMSIGGFLTVMTGIFPEPVLYLRKFFLGATATEPIYFRAVFGVLLTSFIGALSCWTRPNKNETTYLKFIRWAFFWAMGVAGFIFIAWFWFGPLRNLNIGLKIGLAVLLGIMVWFFRMLYFSSQKDSQPKAGLTANTLDQAVAFFKGGKPNWEPSPKLKGLELFVHSSLKRGEVALSQEASRILKAHLGDRIYVSDGRWWLGGLRSGHFVLKEWHNQDNNMVFLSEESIQRAYMILERKVFVEKTL